MNDLSNNHNQTNGFQSDFNSEAKKQLPRYIKALVEIVHSKFDFHLHKKIKMSERIHEILDINWTTSSFNYQINFIANILWISGTLQAEISYTRTNDPKIHIQNLPIPWKQTCQLEYIYPPVIPLSKEKTQYDFTDQVNLNNDLTHYEQTIHHNEIPSLDIINTKIITTKNTQSFKTNPYLILDIYCEISYRIFQHQLIRP